VIESYKRLLKSYVIRNKKLNSNQLQKLDSLSKKYCISQPSAEVMLGDEFGNDQGIICDIGFGRGDSLLEQAQQHNSYNYLGVEVYIPGIINVLSQIEEKQYCNVKLWHGDAVQLLYNHIAADSFNRVQLLYPDPWPKTRHHKRRIVTADFITNVIRVTKNNGYFYFVTDWKPYAEYVAGLLLDHPCLKRVIDVNEIANIGAIPNIKDTKYAAKGKTKGHVVTELIYKINKS
jgi:tRNA (guanine-N7-)-methyltransferase